MEDQKQRLVERINHLIAGISDESRSSLPEDWPTNIELTIPQARILFFLADGPRRSGEVAGWLGSSLSAATTMVDRLVRRNLVERLPNPEDRRVVLCGLTEAGEQVVEDFSRVRRLRLERVATVLSIEELETVARAMEILSTGLDRLTWAQPAEGAARAAT